MKSRMRSACLGAVLSVTLAVGMGASGTIPARAADAAPSPSRLALSQPVRELNIDGQSFSRVIDFLRDLSGANIVVNWRMLEGAGVTRDTQITMQVRSLPLRRMLQLVLDQASPNAPLTFDESANVIEITTQEEADKKLITRVYPLHDLVLQPYPVQLPTVGITVSGGAGGGGGGGGLSGGAFGGSGGGMSQNQGLNSNAAAKTSDQRGLDVVELIRSLVRPNIWSENGGPASLRYYSGMLIITAPASVQEAIGGPINAGSALRFGE